MLSASPPQRLTARSSRGRVALCVAAVLISCPVFAQDGRAPDKEKPKTAANKTPEKAAVVSTAMLMVLTLIFGYRGKKPTIPGLLMAVIETGRISLDIILIGAAALSFGGEQRRGKSMERNL